MRSVGCGLLLLAFWIAPAVSQAPETAPWPTLDEARATSACDTTRWVKGIAHIKAADPERDAESQIAAGNFSLKWLKGPRAEVGTLLLPRELDTVVSVRRGGEQAAGRFIDPIGQFRFAKQKTAAGASCYLDSQPTEAFPLADYAEDRSTDSLSKWCVRAFLVLANDYTRRFNQRTVGDPTYPYKDICTANRATHPDVRDVVISGPGAIAAKPSPYLIPSQISHVATAARFGLADRIARFITDGADVGQRDMFGFDALRWAVVRDYRPVFDLLIAAGGKSDFCAALEAAVVLARVGVVAPLASRCGSDERLQLLALAIKGGNYTFDRSTAPTIYFRIGAGDEEVMRPLMDADPPLLLSGSRELADALLRLPLERMRPFLDRAAAEPSRVSDWWDGMLDRAVAGWRLHVAELLLERGAHPGPGVVHDAVVRRAPNVVQLLARHGGDLDRGRPQLLQRVAQTDVVHDPLGRRYLPSPPADADPPIFTALHPLMDFKMVNLLLELGASPNVRDVSGRTPLMIAITHSRIYGKKGGAPWIEPFVPPHLLEGQEDWAHRGVEPVRALLAKGADVTLADTHGLTALHHAARSDYNVEIAEILLRHGADVNARDASGRTPLDHGRAAKLTLMPEFLEAAGGRGGSR